MARNNLIYKAEDKFAAMGLREKNFKIEKISLKLLFDFLTRILAASPHPVILHYMSKSPAHNFTFLFLNLLQVVKAASPALLRVIAMGAFLIYCTVSI